MKCDSLSVFMATWKTKCERSRLAGSGVSGLHYKWGEGSVSALLGTRVLVAPSALSCSIIAWKCGAKWARDKASAAFISDEAPGLWRTVRSKSKVAVMCQISLAAALRK